MKLKKIAMILVLSFLFSTLGVMNKNVYAAITSNNIEIIANTLNVRQEKSTNCKILCKLYQDEIYKVIAMDKDSQGRIWYKVNADFYTLCA